MPLLIETEDAALVCHESVDEFPVFIDAGDTDTVQVGTGAGSGGIGGGGGGGGVGAGGMMQQGGASCANTCVGVTKPVASAIVAPKSTVAKTVHNPITIG